jgi:hypothetical protein
MFPPVEELREQIAEIAENIKSFKRESTTLPVTKSRKTLKSTVAEIKRAGAVLSHLVVFLSLLCVSQDLIGLGYGLKPVLCLFITWMRVRMILLGEPTV